MGTGKPQKIFLNISNNEIIPDKNFPDCGTTIKLTNIQPFI